MKTDGNTQNQAAQALEILPQKANSPELEKHWFVYRYKTLTTHVRDHFRKSSLEVFFPHRHVRRKSEHTGKTESVEQAIVPGYIFVHAGLDEAINLGKAIDMSLWRRQHPLQVDASTILTEDSHDLKEYKALKLAERTATYYTIDDDAMRQLIRVVELSTLDFHILDASDIDLQKDDFVEIIDGDFKGTRGYLKSINGSGGGVIVVPLEEESRSHNGGRITLFCYGIPAKSSEISILSFAKGTRRSTVLMHHAHTMVDELMKTYTEGKNLTPQQTNRLLGYAHRYNRTEFDRPIQRANQALLLYRIYTILELSTERTPIEAKLINEIFPDCRKRIELLRKGDKENATNTLRSYTAKKLEADEAHQKRIEALAEMPAKR